MPINNHIQFPFKREISELYATVTIDSFAKSMVIIFEPIFLYSLGYSVQKILFFFLYLYILYFFLVPLGGKIAVKLGFEHALFYSVPFSIIYYLALYGISFFPLLFFIVPVISALQRMFFWPAYHSNLAYYGQDGYRGRELSILKALELMVKIISPILGGLILKLSGFNILFIVVSILMFISVIPLFTTKEIFIPGRLSYWDCFKRLFAKKNKRDLFGFMGWGEEIVVGVIWPIFIFIILKNYFSVGFIIALSTFTTVLVMLYIGKLTDRWKKTALIKLGTFFYSFVSFLRIFVKTGFQVFLIDSFSGIFKIMLATPIFTLMYEKASRSSIAKNVVFREQALILGKVMVALLICGLLFFTSNLNLVFIPAALISLLYMLIK